MKYHNPYVIGLLIPLHFLCVALLSVTYDDLSWINLLYVAIGWFLFGCVGIEIAMHRFFSHRSFSLEKNGIVRYVLLWLACMGGQHSPIWWASVHNKLHHPHADKIEDIHSPIHGKFHAYIGWMFKIDPRKISLLRSGDLVKDSAQMFFHRHYLKIFWVSILVFYAILDLSTLLTLIIIPIILSMHQENIVNLFCHLPSIGYRNFDTNDNSRNISLLGVLFWGQGYHNNHHAYPKRYDFAMASGEFDVCKYVVPFIVWIDGKTSKVSWK